MSDEAYDSPIGFPVRTAGTMNHATVRKKFNEDLIGSETQWNCKILPGKAISDLLLSQQCMH